MAKNFEQMGWRMALCDQHKSRFGAACGFLLAALGIPANAGAQDVEIPDPYVIVENFDIDNIRPLLSDLEMTSDVRQMDNGLRYIHAAVGDKFQFALVPSACADEKAQTGCAGASIVAEFASVNLNQQTVRAFNQKYAFTTAGILPGGNDAYLGRYEIADYGIPRGNIASSLYNFVVLAERFRGEIMQGNRTVSVEGYVDDMSARLLNGRVAAGMGVEQADMAAANRHSVSFERLSETIMLMNASQSAPKNKIRNLINK